MVLINQNTVKFQVGCKLECVVIFIKLLVPLKLALQLQIVHQTQVISVGVPLFAFQELSSAFQFK
jgi:hypothetical protein